MQCLCYLKRAGGIPDERDGTLPEKYRDLKFEVPRIGSDDYDSYEETPYDFCFLFDAQNKDGKKLTSFEQYKEHAANCIYAQSIGPMNKRSNSSEDNVVRLCAKQVEGAVTAEPEALCWYIHLKILKNIWLFSGRKKVYLLSGLYLIRNTERCWKRIRKREARDIRPQISLRINIM